MTALFLAFYCLLWFLGGYGRYVFTGLLIGVTTIGVLGQMCFSVLELTLRNGDGMRIEMGYTRGRKAWFPPGSSQSTGNETESEERP